MTTYPEPHVARTLGLRKLYLVPVRRVKLTKGLDWLLVDGVVHYTEPGLTALGAALKLDPALVVGAAEKIRAALATGPGPASLPPAAAAPQGEASAAAPKASAVDIVVTGRSPNPLIVFGTVEGEPVKVRVRSNANFIPGLVVRATPSALGHYNMIGQPPRWRGDRHGFTRPPATQPPA